jgi:arylsulfatase A-like enzyme
MTPTLGSWPVLAYRDRRWKYIQTFDPAGGIDPVFEELYDLASDRDELLNVAPGQDLNRFRQRLSLARQLCHA